MEPTTAGSPEPGLMSEPGRLTGIFWDPKAVFRDLAARPRWWTPILLLTALALLFNYVFSRLVGWGAFLARELASNPRTAELSPDQIDKLVRMQAGFVGIFAYAAALLATAVVVTLVAAILLFLFRTIGAPDLNFRQALSITSYSWLPMVLYQLLALVVLCLADPRDFNLKNPLPFNAGWFLDPSSLPAWLVSLASSVDLFSFWVMALLALGFSVTTKKMRYGKALAGIFSLWLVYVLVKTGWTAVMG